MSDGAAVLNAITPVSRETVKRLQCFEALLRRWQRKTNLVGPDTLPNFWTHHVADGAFVYAHAPETSAWTDIGAGAGLPGLVIAALAAGDGRNAQVDLVESNAKKCAFQRAAVLEMGLRDNAVTVGIHCRRIEEHRTRPDGVLTARALAPLADLLDHTRTLGVDRGLFLKGDRHTEEIEAARERHRFDVEIVPHPLRSGSVLLDVKL